VEGNVVSAETKAGVLKFINEHCADGEEKWPNGYNVGAFTSFIGELKNNLKHDENQMYSLAEVFTDKEEAEKEIGLLFELAQRCELGVKMLFEDEKTKVFDEAFFGNVQISKETFDKIATKTVNDEQVQDFQPSALKEETKNYIKALCPETAKTYFAGPTDPMKIPQNNDNVEQKTVVPQKSFFKSVKDFFDLPKVKAALWFTAAALSVVASVAAAIPTFGGSLFGLKLAGIMGAVGISKAAAIGIGAAAIAGGVAGVGAAGYYGAKNVKVAIDGYGNLENSNQVPPAGPMSSDPASIVNGPQAPATGTQPAETTSGNPAPKEDVKQNLLGPDGKAQNAIIEAKEINEKNADNNQNKEEEELSE